MVSPITNTNINIPQGPFLDPTTGRPATPWLLWLQNPNFVSTNLANPLSINSGGTQVVQNPENGQMLIGNNGQYTLNNLNAGKGVTIVNGEGEITLVNNGVVSLSGGETGLVVDDSAGTDVITGTLNEKHGGTNQTTYAKGDILYASATNVLSKLSKPSVTGYLQMTSAGVPSWSTSTGGVSSFSGGATGLTPSVPTTGAIVLNGVLSIAHGGTGTSTAGASGSFTTADSKTVTVVNGFITSIV